MKLALQMKEAVKSVRINNLRNLVFNAKLWRNIRAVPNLLSEL